MNEWMGGLENVKIPKKTELMWHFTFFLLAVEIYSYKLYLQPLGLVCSLCIPGGREEGEVGGSVPAPSLVFHLTCLMGVDSRSQLTTAKKEEVERRTVRLAQLSYLQSVRWKGCISPKDRAFNPHLDDTGKMRDWWPKVQGMTGHTIRPRLPFVIEQRQVRK